MSVERDEIATSGFVLLAMTIRASVESFVKFRCNSFDSTNSAYKPCSHRRDAEEPQRNAEKDNFRFEKDKDRRMRRPQRKKHKRNAFYKYWEKKKGFLSSSVEARSTASGALCLCGEVYLLSQ